MPRTTPLIRRPPAVGLLLALAAACTRTAPSTVDDGTNAGPTSSASPEKRSIAIKGSDTMVVLGQRWAEDFMKANPAIVVQVSGGGSATGIAALINGSADICESSRPMSESERAALLKTRGVTAVETKVAMDALAVYVNETNTIREISLPTLARVYEGEVTSWRSVGGADHAVVLYGRENNSGTYEYFKEHVLADADFAAAMQTLGGTSAVSNAVKEDAFGIGFGGIAYGDGVHALALRRTDDSRPVTPSLATTQDGTYPLSRFLFFYTAGESSPSIERFVLWVAGPEGQETITDVGYYPLPKKS